MSEITLITGSTLGGTEYVGDHLAALLEQEGYTVKVINEAELVDVTSSKCLLLITSTHGAGDYPDNLLPLMEALNTDKPDLSGLEYAVIAIGDSSYDTFCGAGINADKQLKTLGAKRVIDRLDIDICTHPLPEEPAELWLSQYKNQLCE
ncbi:FMN-binding protein MioC [Enterovibrio norvegicus FF-33]|uniref:FMN-binding protein MioC n=1 Tax=Enterovibrio norvegicus FF-454 TaxID=1185651 RepID=A0A1E5C1P9_9GAMM|nr:FMN-binding protein MioC [Enterovibrio norvegicus]OEE59409.1 FMN-binding protein MioC [Enterovibrio norvegicus FF-454]OEE65449.1 FMN-binding protein MioC [Enterovibrio norvegicus FF-33]OEE86759.1 FMN-binding protein MioC [Enterovibrio norvegicus FF-162]